jgi:hypothetical protein
MELFDFADNCGEFRASRVIFRKAASPNYQPPGKAQLLRAFLEM